MTIDLRMILSTEYPAYDFYMESLAILFIIDIHVYIPSSPDHLFQQSLFRPVRGRSQDQSR